MNKSGSCTENIEVGIVQRAIRSQHLVNAREEPALTNTMKLVLSKEAT